MPPKLMQNFFRVYMIPKQGDQEIGKLLFPFVAVRVNLMPEMEEYVQVRNLMYICSEEKIWVKVVVQCNTRMTFASLAGKVTYFCLPAFR
jgi:hypothetical protein